MSRHALIVPIAALMLVASLPGCAPTSATAPAPDAALVNYEGLATVRSRNFDVAQVRPGTDFSAYSRLRLGTPDLAYRAPDSSKRQFPLSEEQKSRFRDNLISAFDEAFAGLQILDVVDEPGPDTLVLAVRVEDIVVTVAPSTVGRAGRGAALLEASGGAVMTIELRDSQSNAILARGVDAADVSGGALQTPEGELRTRFESSEKILETWASKARSGVENLLGENR
jgi:hypothetical protein